MGCFLCKGSSDEEGEKKKMKNENGGRAGSTSKQPLSEPTVVFASRVASDSASAVISEARNMSRSEESYQDENGRPSEIAGRTFTFQELAVVTQNFQIECLIGEGGFGAVYKGRLQDNGQVVAVKKLDTHGLQGDREFNAEVVMLSSLHHQNLVKLIGFCSEEDQRLLVYEFMPLGSLEDHLHDVPFGKEPLDWNTRMKIAAGAAMGIKYLHEEVRPPVIYRDLKASNILLDEGYFPKLSDFGLARSGPVGDRTHVSTRVMGTYGYCAPEYAMTGQLTLKSDVYSFGVVLLEMITGRKAIDYTRPLGERSLVAWARPLFRDGRNFSKMADPLLQGRYPGKSLYRAIVVAAMCLQEQAEFRPAISEVVSALNYLASKVYDPNAATPQTQSSTQRPVDSRRRDLDSERDSGRGDGTGRMQDSNGSQLDELQKDSPVTRECPKNVNRDWRGRIE